MRGVVGPQQRRGNPAPQMYEVQRVEEAVARGGDQRQWSGEGRQEGVQQVVLGRIPTTMEQKANFEPDDDDGGGELDEMEKELLGEVDADESDDEDGDEDDEMVDD